MKEGIATGTRRLPENEFAELPCVVARREPMFAKPNHHQTQHQENNHRKIEQIRSMSQMIETNRLAGGKST